jgi:thymidylate synthase (FAD)
MKVLDKGYVNLEQYWGSEELIAKTAGISYNNTNPNIARVIRKIMKHENYGTPFEHAGATVKVKAPIFVFRQWFRHRIGFSYNEISGRYVNTEPEWYIPNTFPEEMRKIQKSYSKSYENYIDLMNSGVKREQARAILGTGMYSTAYISANLRAWLHFLTLRTDEHAQEEIRKYANGIKHILKERFPNIMEEWES